MLPIRRAGRAEAGADFGRLPEAAAPFLIEVMPPAMRRELGRLLMSVRL
jgi:hypothetical protein